MQDRYTGDIGDFAKYGLLRALAAASTDASYRLGVIWYRTPDETHRGDGRHVQYLLPEGEDGYRPCDPTLYDELRSLVMSGDRSVAAVRIREILPEDTIFYESLLSYAGASPGRRPAVREAWLDQAVHASTPCDLVFLDPDNGLRSPAPEGKAQSTKSVSLDELRPFYARGQSLVVYHHFARQNHPAQLREWATAISRTLGLAHQPIAVRFKTQSARACFIIPAEPHRMDLTDALKEFVAGPWGAHFPPDQAIGL